MALTTDKKLFLGARLRRLRRDLGLTQSRMAEDLGVSPSYLNHLERNQRPLTAQVLLRLADTYDIDLKSFSADTEAGGADRLTEVFADGLFRDIGVARHELQEVAENAPGVVEGITRLYQAYIEGRDLAQLGRDGFRAGRTPGAGSGQTGAALPSEWVRDYIQAQRNHFPELEDHAAILLLELNRENDQDLFGALRDSLAGTHGVQVRIMPADMLTGSLRRYDHHRKRLFLSELLSEAGRVFSTAYQLAVLRFPELLNDLTERAAPPDRPIRNLLKVSLGNYIAAAVLMPYEAFHTLAEGCGYDLNMLRARFGVSYEQVCHRLTTLGRPNARGIPFFMLRVDAAGNISKRFAGAAFPFSRFGGTCPRWNIHSCVKTPGRIVTQIVETPDGQRYFTLSRTVKRNAAIHTEEDSELAVGLGCELKFASRLVYSKGLDLNAPHAVAIGPACRICERPACPQRAAEPVNRILTVEDGVKSISPYPFASR